MTRPLNILFVDDEFSPDTPAELGGYMSYYELELHDTGRHNVTRAIEVEAALGVAKNTAFDLAIIDMMMPPGSEFRNVDTQNGLATGTHLARRLHELQPGLRIWILSNAAQYADLFHEVVDERVVDRVLYKLDYTPSDLLSAVNETNSQDTLIASRGTSAKSD